MAAKDISLVGATFYAVPQVDLPINGGGTASFVEISDTTATAADVASGKYFYTSAGVKTEGTASGGGGGGVVVTDTTDIHGGTIREITAVVLNNDTVTAASMLSGVTAHDSSGTAITGSIASKTSSDLTVSGDTVTAPAGYYASAASTAVSAGTAGTPTATKGAVNNHSVSVTPSVTNSTGYITGSTKTGTAVSVSASELVSGSETKTANGTYDVTNLAELVVNVSGTSKNVQILQSTSRTTSTSYTKLCGDITVAKTGTYHVYWDSFRTSTSNTWGTQLYIDDVAYGSAQSTFSNHVQNVHLSNVSLTANQKVSVYGRSRGSNYYAYVGQLTIIEA